MEEPIFTLPGGYVDDAGIVHKEIELSPLNGKDEEILAAKKNSESASLVTNILARRLIRLGTIHPVPKKIIQELLVADRQFIMIKLRQITFGDKVTGTVNCPWQNCGSKIDLDFSINDIPVTRKEIISRYYSFNLSDEASSSSGFNKSVEIVYRLPNGNDQEILSALLKENDAVALTALLQNCITEFRGFDSNQDTIVNLSPLARIEIEDDMMKNSPLIDSDMVTTCPECTRQFTLPFDYQNFFFGELRTNLDLLYRQVHYLAYHYHWSEEEILQMQRNKRQKYIEILADEIERINSAAEAEY